RKHFKTTSDIYVKSALVRRSLAVREALLHAKAPLNSKQHPVKLYGINLDIEKLTSSFSSITVAYVPRTLNSAADALAKTALYYSNA
ncbi:hypothetical protein IGI04_029182, partial [Brassica rapa subsp. trilocularis]